MSGASEFSDFGQQRDEILHKLFELVDKEDVESLKNLKNSGELKNKINDESIFVRVMNESTMNQYPLFLVSKVMKHLYAELPELLQEINSKGQSVVSLAMIKCVQYTVITNLLREAPIFANIADLNGTTPLMHACANGKNDKIGWCYNVIKLLLNGARDLNINARDKNERNALDYLLIPNPYPDEDVQQKAILTLEEIIEKQQEVLKEVARALLGIKINAMLFNLDTVNLVDLLLEHKIEVLSTNGTNIFQYIDRVSVAVSIVKYEPTILNRPDNNGWMPLHHAINNGYEKVCLYLLSEGAIIEEGINPVLLASEKNFSFGGITKLLLRYPNVDINARNKNGDTLLTLYGYSSENVDFLIDLYRADASVLGSKGQSPLIRAIHDPTALMKLLRFGADPFAESEDLNKFLPAIFRKFTSCEEVPVDGEMWLELLVCIASTYPQFTSLPVPQQIIDWIQQIILPFNTENHIHYNETAKAFEAIFRYSPYLSKIQYHCRLPTLNYCKFNESTVNPLTLLLSIIKLEDHVQIMILLDTFLKCGFTFNEEISDNVSSFSVVLLRYDYIELETITPYNEYFFLRGFNEGSQALTFTVDPTATTSPFFENINELREEFAIPDGLLLGLLRNEYPIVQILLRHYWAPPLALLTLLPRPTEDTIQEMFSSFVFWFKLLNNSREPVIHGVMCDSVVTVVETYLTDAERFLDHDDDLRLELPSTRKTLNLIKSTPLSLRQLAKYTVRKKLAERARRSDRKFPDLLSEVMDPPLLYLLTNPN